MQKLDIIVFGATGFTGKYVVKNLTHLSKQSEYSDISWGISGRSKEKLYQLLNELAATGADISKIPIIVGDVNDEDSMKDVSKRTKVLMNCTGPYTVLGDQVVKACIESGTHYVDISAELHHMLTIYRKYYKAAEQAKVLIISACGFGSIPIVMGLMHLCKEFKDTLHTVECYMQIDIPKRALIPGCNKCLVHYGTWASLVHELQNLREYMEMKKETFPEPIVSEAEPEGFKKCFFHRHNGRWWFPYPGPDDNIVDMTQRYHFEKNRKKPVHFKTYTTMPLLIHFFIVIPAFLFYYYMCYFKCFRNLLWKYPGFFSLGYMNHKGPSEEMNRDMKYSCTFYGKGWDKDGSASSPNKSMTLKVSGSDPGYGTTSLAFIFSAITILRDYETMPKGGVLTTGAAFYDTQLVDRLKSNGFIFEIGEKGK